MSMHTQMPAAKTAPEIDIQSISENFIRYALVIVFLWFGALKFTAYEANAIAGLAINSPMLAWLHNYLGVQGFSNLIGFVEISAALLLMANHYRAVLGVIGGLMASLTFLVTLSFMFTTPGIVEVNAGGFPIISVMPGQFLFKDLVLLAVSVWLTATSLQSIKIEWNHL